MLENNIVGCHEPVQNSLNTRIEAPKPDGNNLYVGMVLDR